MTTITWTSTPDPTTGGKFKLRGTCVEQDVADPGQSLASYPCKAKGTDVSTPNPDGTSTEQISFNVLETSTAR